MPNSPCWFRACLLFPGLGLLSHDVISVLPKASGVRVIFSFEEAVHRSVVEVGEPCGGFKKLGAFLGVLIMRIMAYWGLFWGLLFMETPMFSCLMQVQGAESAQRRAWEGANESFSTAFSLRLQ